MPRAKILLIEPNRVLARQYALSIGADGHDVEWVSDGQMAVYAADKKRPDVVVAELVLAGHSGVEFLYEFRTYRDWLDIPVVALTGVPPHDLADNFHTLQSLGVSYYLYKPHTTLAYLRSVVKRSIPMPRAV